MDNVWYKLSKWSVSASLRHNRISVLYISDINMGVLYISYTISVTLFTENLFESHCSIWLVYSRMFFQLTGMSAGRHWVIIQANQLASQSVSQPATKNGPLSDAADKSITNNCSFWLNDVISMNELVPNKNSSQKSYRKILNRLG